LYRYYIFKLFNRANIFLTIFVREKTKKKSRMSTYGVKIGSINVTLLKVSIKYLQGFSLKKIHDCKINTFKI